MPRIWLPANGRVYWPEDSDNEHYYDDGTVGYYWADDQTGAYGAYALQFSESGAFTTSFNAFETGCSVIYVRDIER